MVGIRGQSNPLPSMGRISFVVLTFQSVTYRTDGYKRRDSHGAPAAGRKEEPTVQT